MHSLISMGLVPAVLEAQCKLPWAEPGFETPHLSKGQTLGSEDDVLSVPGLGKLRPCPNSALSQIDPVGLPPSQLPCGPFNQTPVQSHTHCTVGLERCPGHCPRWPGMGLMER